MEIESKLEEVAMTIFLDADLRVEVESGNVPGCLQNFAEILPQALIVLRSLEQNIDEIVVGLDFL